VAQFTFLIGYFSNIVEQTGSFRQFRVQSEFCRHSGAKIGRFLGKNSKRAAPAARS